MTVRRDATRHDIVVIGAGMVGVCCALWLKRNGHRVWLVDGNDPGTGASGGNACSIATHACVPINHPDLFGKLPGLLLGGLFGGGALSIDPRYAIRHAAWFANFLKHCRAVEVEKTTRALGQLLTHTHDGLKPLVEMAGCGNLFQDKGCLYAYRRQQDFIADQKNLRTRRTHGVHYREIDTGELQELEPNLKIRFARGALFEHSQSVVNPRSLVNAFFECFQQHGGKWRKQNATAVRHDGKRLEVLLADGESVAADKVVLAAGAFSRQIAGSGAEALPLETERGYHIQFSDRQHLANRTIHWVGSGFYATPTDQGLRFAGIVELAGLQARKNQKILNYLTRTAQQMFDLPPQADQTWLGYRPTFPDALPVIGPSSRSPNILLAFGHQHLGLTLAGITGRIISQLVDNDAPAMDITPFRADRFFIR